MKSARSLNFKKIKILKIKLLKICDRFATQNSAPKTILNYHSDFELLIAVVLSARTRDEQVNKVTEKLFKIANTPEKFILLSLIELESLIKSIGFYKNKSKNLLKTAEILVKNYHSKVPNNRADLESLPGVGRKTANVLLSILFNQPTIAVDTHVYRVSKRLGIASGNTPREIEEQLLTIVPQSLCHSFHHWLVLHGRHVCRSQRPLCSQCLIADYCDYFNKK